MDEKKIVTILKKKKTGTTYKKSVIALEEKKRTCNISLQIEVERKLKWRLIMRIGSQVKKSLKKDNIYIIHFHKS